MRRFSFEFSYHEIFEQPARLIAWFTYVIIMQKSHSHKEMLWYIEQAYKNGWSIVYLQVNSSKKFTSLFCPNETHTIE